MNLEDPAVVIGALTVSLGAASFLNAFLTNRANRKVEARTRATELHTSYYSSDNYHRVVLPVTRILLKWDGLPDDQREAYRAAVRRGWVGFDDAPERLLRSYVDDSTFAIDPDEAHFRTVASAGEYSEHESLALYLYFWTRVDEMIAAGLVEKSLVVRIMSRSYRYGQSFMAKLRTDIEAHAKPGELPAWFAATKRLDKILGD
ncbi:MAG: hypothetical protein AAGA39_11755 [Pseudomonadota bacterium]